MTDRKESNDDALLARAVRGAAQHAPAAPEARERVRAAAHAAWRDAVEENGGLANGDSANADQADGTVPGAPPRRWPLALAASVALLALGAGLAWRAREAAPTVAVAELVRGSVSFEHPSWAGARVAALAPQVGLALRDTVVSGAASGAVLRLGPGLTLRLAPDSRLVLDTAGHVTLAAGSVYVDADPGFGRQPLEVATSRGVVSHLGTQYAVTSDGSQLELAVREGRVQLAQGRALPLQAGAGELLRLDAKGVSRTTLARDDARWGWLAQLPAPFDTNGATLSAFLAWYARETGHEIVFTAPADARRAAEVRIGGSIAGLGPEQALDVVAAATGLDLRREGSRVLLTLP